MIPIATLERRHVESSPPKEKPLLRVSDASVAFSEEDLQEYITLSEKYYGIRPTTQEALDRCTMIVTFLRIVWTGEIAAADIERSGGQA